MHSAWLYALFPLALMMISRETPWLPLGLLLVYGGAIRSLQMTAVNTVMIVDVPGNQVNAATTFSAVSQQVSQAVSVALAALIINVTVWWLGDSTTALRIADFRPALLRWRRWHRWRRCAGTCHCRLPRGRCQRAWPASWIRSGQRHAL
jgi:hypothetical protein